MIQIERVSFHSRMGKEGVHETGFPFNLKVLRNVEQLAFHSPVTFFVGENGTGKSTLLEAMAVASKAVSAGNESVQTDPSLKGARRLADHMRVTWRGRKSHRGFFLRSEDFINFSRRIADMRMEFEQNLAEIDREYQNRSAKARNLARMPHLRSLGELNSTYGQLEFEEQSHGEGFLRFFSSRLVPNGVYFLDEPETPLSPTRQLSLMAMMKDMVEENAQFIVATHSPILMAFPDARILSFDDGCIREIPYDEVEHVKMTKAFLNRPELFLRHL